MSVTAPARAVVRSRGLVVTGVVTALAAAAATTVVAGVARAVGVDLAVDGEAVPLSGVAFLTAVCSLAGLGLAAALRRWSRRPAQVFARTAWGLTAVSLAPPLLVGADTATSLTLAGLHVVAAAVVVPVLTRRLAV